ncbi:solute carrier family 15 member 4 [Elysia marginata]|uniref:Solute carrier family 15 member 4 n=1 Tax=Elysia marginata TaxID=1093978 RepID=A0AAV4GK00_9GAST|nr:solute carrier family 15 member 4 [Elysia marginata]
MGRNTPDNVDKETDPLLNHACKVFPSSLSDTDLVSTETPPLDNQKIGSQLATLYILATEMGERLAYYSITSGLVLYCTSNLHMDQAEATTLNQVFVGLLLMPVSTLKFSNWGWAETDTTQRRVLFLTGLALAAIGMGGIKANMSPFGAEQVESRGKEAVRSFFSWFYWIINVGALLAYTVSAYVHQEINFAWGFCIPAISMALAAFVFFLGKSKYKKTEPSGSLLATAIGICHESSCRARPKPNQRLPEGSERKFLAGSKKSFSGSYDDHLVDGVTSVVKVIRFCFLSIMYWAIHAQMSNTFYAQAERMDVRLGGGMNIPAAALQASNTTCVILLIPVFDKLIYPFFERIGRPLTYLKRIGIGMIFAAAGVTVAGVVEIYRKRVLNSEQGAHIQILAGESFTASNMSVFVQVPQFFLIGTSEIFASVTFLEFAYNQAPVAMQGLLTGLFFLACGIGNWMAAVILSIVQVATKHDPWWSSEINDAKMENLMFLLAGLILFNTVVFCIVAHYYTYQDRSQFEAAQTQTERGQSGTGTQNDGMLTSLHCTQEDGRGHEQSYDSAYGLSESDNGSVDNEGLKLSNLLPANDRTVLLISDLKQ